MKKRKYRKVNRAIVELSINEYYAVKKKEKSYEILISIVARKLKINKKQIKNIVWFNKLKLYVYYYSFHFQTQKTNNSLDKAISITINALSKF